MANYYTTEYNMDSQAPSLANMLLKNFHLECLPYTYTVPAGGVANGSILYVRLLPPGDTWFFPILSRIQFTDMGTGTLLDIGYAAYTGYDGVAVVADDNLFDDDVDVAASAGEAALGSDFTIAVTTTTTGQYKKFSSKTGVSIIATVSGSSLAAAGTIDGYLIIGRAG